MSEGRPRDGKEEAEAEQPAEVDRRKAILRAAVSVFASKGYHGCRIADVAKQAGVAYGIVYHYFRNKEELLESVFSESFGRFARLLGEIAKTDAPTEQKVGDIVALAIDSFRHDPMGVRVFILEIARSPAFRDASQRSVYDEAIRLTGEVLKQGQQRGEVKPDIDPMVGAYMLFGAIELALTGFVLGTIAAGDEDQVASARRSVVEIFLRGVAGTDVARSAAAAASKP